MILFGLRDTGSVNACLPVIQILKEVGVPVSVYAEAAAQVFLKDKVIFVSESRLDHLLDTTKLVVATTAHKGGNRRVDLIQKAKSRNLPVILVEDMWAGHSAFNGNVLPDGVCVMDEFAKSLILQSWPNYPESHVHITGSPVFDNYAGFQKETARRKLRKVFSLSQNWPTVFFAGQVWGMPQAIKMFIEALNDFDYPFYLILTDHPSVVLSEATEEFKRIYLEYRNELGKLRVGKVVDPNGLTSREIMAGSDIVVGMYSSMTVEACYLRKPVLIIWSSEIGQSLSDALNNRLNEWPITSFGASLKAESVNEIKNCLGRIIVDDAEDMKSAQEKHFKTDGLNGRRMAEAILGYYNN